MLTPRIGVVIAAAALFLQGCTGGTDENALPEAVDFNFHIRPILSNSCYVCHGPDISTREADLRLDTFEGATARREGGPAIVPGNPYRSLLIDRISDDDLDVRMPPAQTNKRLTQFEIALLSKWIDQGAEYKTHWALIPPESTDFENAESSLQPIDRFVNRQLGERGLPPAAEASRESLIRRASYVLTGLPPTPEQVDAFLEDGSAEAYEKVLDQLLASPHFGERWARHWMDLVRYAEAKGHEFDFTIHGAWQYRDYLIRAFNADVPYDDFVTEHLAGDLLISPRLHPTEGFNESVIGTAYFGLGEGKHSPVNTRIDEAERIDNIIDVTTKTFQGLTVACARCHDHKFDPIPTTDYYSLYGIIESSRFAPTPIMSSGYRAALDSLKDMRQRMRSDMAAAWRASAERTPVLAAARQTAPAHAADTSDSWVMLGDFRSGTLSGWFPQGPAFETAGQGTPVVPNGRLDSLEARFISSHQLVTGLPGALRSATFTLAHDTITVMAAGHKSVIRIVVDNFQLIRAPIHGGLDQEVASEELAPYRFDVAMWKGHKAYVELLVGTYDKDRFITEHHQLVVNDSSYIAAAWAVAHDSLAPQIPPVAAAATPLGPSIAAWENFRATPDQLAALNRALAEGQLERPELRAQLGRARRIQAGMPELPFFIGVVDGDRVTSAVFGRGNYLTPVGEPVPHRALTVLDPTETPFTRSASGRRDLASVIADPANPLTGRVMVNRLWHHAFGRGIVKTVDNFGAQGTLPTHPGLLDYLALRFVELDWSVKAMLREILLSDAFRRSTGESADSDPENLLLAHYPVRRLEAEAIRDGMLAVSGRLDPALFGPPVPIHLTEFMKGRGRPAENGPLDGEGRRSVYISVRRNFLSPMMLAFDKPIPFSTFGARNSSNVPAQSLTLLNDPFVAEQASVWAQALINEPHLDIEARVTDIYLKGLARRPTHDELDQAASFILEEAARLDLDESGIMEHAELWTAYCHVVLNLKEFIYLI
ncbi:MAG: PSD1 and planctomycete cytochrome C domain-containing protein [Bacteroidota bacterium]|nr:PSD1 and planctomycete cytochrome C domain-containing protein [Bacteroidota bacterium]